MQERLSRASSTGVTIAPLKRWLISLIVAAALISALAAILSHRNKSRDAARREREIGYAAALNAYSKTLHAGMTRKEVEGYLRATNTQFSWVYTGFGGRRESQMADVVKIGEEQAPVWYCGPGDVHVAFEFTPLYQADPEDTDLLQRIEIEREYDCLNAEGRGARGLLHRSSFMSS